MSPDLAALFAFALVATFTPGPNNLMLMASGANFGIARTLPHMAGIVAGFALMLFGVGAGLARVFEVWPTLHVVLRAASLGYLVWLAWRIARAGRPDASGAAARPLTFLEAALFQ